jgi:hypothetical protein
MMRTALMVLLVAATLTATALAQAPNREQTARGRRGTGRSTWADRAVPGLLAPADAQVELRNVDGGVELVLTTPEPDAVPELQEQVEEAAEDVKNMAERLARWRRRRDMPLPDSLPGMLLEEDVSLDVQHIEQGSVVRLLAGNEQQAQRLQENMSRWVKRARERRQSLAAHYRQAAFMAELRRLVAEGVVQVQYERTEQGVNVRFLTDDPDTARRLQKSLPAYIESLTNSRHQPPRSGRGTRDRDRRREHNG